MRQFGELEAVIMDRLWDWGRPALVRELVDDLHDDRPLAYTTVMTVMENLHRKGWLRRERDGRAWRYEPTGFGRVHRGADERRAGHQFEPAHALAPALSSFQMSQHDAAAAAAGARHRPRA